jgi:hypothetical protein
LQNFARSRKGRGKGSGSGGPSHQVQLKASPIVGVNATLGTPTTSQGTLDAKTTIALEANTRPRVKSNIDPRPFHQQQNNWDYFKVLSLIQCKK